MSDSILQALNSLCHAWGSWMWSMSWQLTLLVFALLILDRLLAGYSARMRHVLWLLVLVRLLIPPSFSAPTSLTWWFGDRIVAARGALGATLDQWLPTSIEASLTAGQASLQTSTTNTHARASELTGLTEHSLTWTSTLFLLWAGVVIARLSLLLYAWSQVRKWLRASVAIIDPASVALLQRAKRRLGLHQPIALADSGACVTPLVTGWSKPVILLPSHVRQTLDAAELEAVLVHELAHVARGDGWVRLGQALLSAVYFFHPAMWLANWQLRRTCEDACDEQTIAALSGQRRCYAEAIFKAAANVGYEPPYLAMNMLESGYGVKRRLQRILDPRLQVSSGGALSRWTFVSLIALVLLPSGLPTTLATTPPSATLSEVGGNQREKSLSANISQSQPEDLLQKSPETLPVDVPTGVPRQPGPSARPQPEVEALTKLESTDFDERMAGYAALERVGTALALARLETAFLQRGGIEQDAAKRALDAVWLQIRSDSFETSTTSRLFIQTPQEN